MEVLIRQARPEDAPVIVKHQLLMAGETENRQLDEAVVTQGVRSVFDDPAKGFYLVAEENGQVVGNLMVTPEWSDWTNRWVWWIQSVFVQPAYRNQGIYRRLYLMARDLGKEKGVNIIRLYVDQFNAQAMHVYGRLGMEHSHYRLYEEIIEK